MNSRAFLCGLSLFMIQAAFGEVTLRIADPNSLIPLTIEEVMPDKPISLVISSDANQPWKGGLFIRGRDRSRGLLTGRGQMQFRLFQDSCLEGTGENALAMHWKDSNIRGFDFYTSQADIRPGDWFVVDYVPLEPGQCKIEFYEYMAEDPNSWFEPRIILALENTPSRDFNGDGIVNFADFSQLASVWLAGSCTEPDWCGHKDLDRDGMVGLTDLLMFSDYWLWGSAGWKPSPGSADPNVLYRITDGDNAQEIDLTVGDSVTLYIQKIAFGKDVFVIQNEAILSDIELGWIENTERDPNDPSGCCTAQILASPRDAMFDWWGPGAKQPEGLQFLMANVTAPIEDGPVASFVYTAAAEGNATISLIDYGTLPCLLEGILIHQTLPWQMRSAPAGQNAMSLPEENTAEFNLKSTQDAPSRQEALEFLETIWDEDPQVREIIGREKWDAFIEQVRADVESTNTDD